MYVWWTMVFLKLIHHPLLAGRLVSVTTGALSAIGIYFLGTEIFHNKRVGILSSLLYVLYPFALVYDKLALYDSMVAMFTIWALYLEVLFVRKLRLDIALILALVIGGGMLTKTSAFFSLALIPFALLLFDFSQKRLKERLANFVLLSLVVVVLANLYYGVLRLSPFYHIIGEKNDVFVYPLGQWVHHPFRFFFGNFHGLMSWLIGYASIPILVLVAISFVVSFKYWREKLLLLAWFSAPFVFLALFGKVLYPRFILFMSMPLLVMAAFSFDALFQIVKKPAFTILIFIVFLSGFLIKDYFLLTNFAIAPIPASDKNQLLNDWPAGIGVKPSVAYFTKQAETQHIFIATEGTFGLMPSAYEIFLEKNPNISIKGIWPIDHTPPGWLLSKARQMPTYMVFYQPCNTCGLTGEAPSTWNVTKVLQYPYYNPNRYFTVYKVNPK